MRVRRHRIGSLLTVLFLLFLGFPIHARAPIQPETVRVGYYDFGDFLQKDAEGNFYGYGYEYLQEIAVYTGWRYKFVLGTWQECLDRLANGEIDLLCSAQYTRERAEVFEYAKYETGSEYAVLYVAPDNHAVFYNDYASFDGLRVGFIPDVYQNLLFREYAKAHVFSYTSAFYDTADELEAALASGEIDAALTGSLQGLEGQKIVAKFRPMPFYFITQKGNYHIMDRINYAMETIQTTDINFNAKLANKFYGEVDYNLLAFTREEESYIAKTPVLRVVYNDDWSPVAHYNQEDGTFDGICSGVMDVLSERSGIQFRFLPAHTEMDAANMLQSGEADLICGFPSRYSQEVSEYHISLTKCFFEVPLTLAKLRDRTFEEIEKIAVPENCMALIQYASDLYPKARIEVYPSTEACLQAVRRGSVDAVFENLYVLDQYSRDRYYSNIDTILSVRETFPICIGVGADQDPILRNLLNKLISQLDADKVNEIVVENTMAGPRFPWEIILIRFALPAAVILVLLILLIVLRFEKRIEHYAFIDPLTGRDNENRFLLSAEKLLRAQGYQGYAVASLDIDKFKLINDMHSFEIGNQVLQAVSDVIAINLHPLELSCREVNDHFILLIRGTARDHLDARMQDLVQKITAIPRESDKNFQLTVSCGVYVFEKGDSDIRKAIGWASLARKSAKGRHQDCVSYYDDSMRKKATREQEIENRMEDALAGNEFVVYYQPKIRLSDETVVGAEALVRWLPKDGRIIYPDQFIPVFESNGFIIRLDLYVFRRVCEQLRAWLDAGQNPCPISVNLSRVHLGQPNFYQQYLQMLDEYHLSPRYIEIELTESTMYDNQAQMIALIGELKKVGLAVSMDDFGSGYSSLNLLKDLPIDFLKLDKEFFNTASDSQRGKNVIESVIYMAEKLHVTVIAEGVETQEQVNFCKEISCDVVQGYYFSKPVPASEICFSQSATT